MLNVDEIMAKMEVTAKAEGIALHPNGLGVYCRWNSDDGSISWVLTDSSGPACLPVATSIVDRDQAEQYLRELSGICPLPFGALK
ncbi:hypothetical protein PQR39_21100 [Paraburkholderia sediminicola]|uniref:hypothetical protein n=1 Tax=Paraburkholderia sediminicola TaxID=458836 RepID=UPI0038B6B39D